MELHDEEFKAICNITSALLDEGPVEGISKINHVEEIFVKLFKHAAKMGPISLGDYEILKEMAECVQVMR